MPEEKKILYYDAIDFQRFRALSEYSKKIKMIHQMKEEERHTTIDPISYMINSIYELLAPPPPPKMKRCISHSRCLNTLEINPELLQGYVRVGSRMVRSH